MLGKRVDLIQRFATSCALPVRGELGRVQPAPFFHQPKLAVRQRTSDDDPGEVDRGLVPSIPSMEVRPGVAAFVPVHRDHDPVEDTDPRHFYDTVSISAAAGSASLRSAADSLAAASSLGT
jgi:hypothetical protein